MVLDKVFLGGKKEREALEKIRQHIGLLCSACEALKAGIEKSDEPLLYGVSDLEREGDSIRREILSTIYDGAFLPFLRSGICNFVETVDKAIDMTKDAAIEYKDLQIISAGSYNHIDECVDVADLNQKMCEMLLIAFRSLSERADLREKNLAIRIYEKRIDELKYDLMGKLRAKKIDNFWEGKLVSDFAYHLTGISDLIEDAGDYLQILNVSLR